MWELLKLVLLMTATGASGVAAGQGMSPLLDYIMGEIKNAPRSLDDVLAQSYNAAGPRGATVMGKPASKDQLLDAELANRSPGLGNTILGYNEAWGPWKPSDYLDQQDFEKQHRMIRKFVNPDMTF